MNDSQILEDSHRNIPEKSLKLLQTASRISDTLALLDGDNLMGGSSDRPIANRVSDAIPSEPRLNNETSIKPVNSLGLHDHKLQDNLKTDSFETQRETTTIYKISQSGEQKENVDIAFLMNRIAALESKTQPVAAAEDKSLKLKLEVLRRQNHELQSKSSKQELEIKALLDQNDILRKENRRMHEVESSLRLRLVDAHPSVPTAKLDIGDQVSQERILQKLDDLVGQIASAESQVHENPNNSKHILVYRNVLLSCKKIVKNVADTSPANVLNLCKSITEVTSESFDHVWEIIKESQGLDAKIEKLRKEALAVNQDATETIKLMSNKHNEEVTTLQSSNAKLEHQLSALTEKYQQLKEHYKAEHHRPELKPEVVVLPSSSTTGMESQLESLKNRNAELHVHIDNLNATIKGWKEENESLQEEFSHLKKEKAQWERERLENMQIIGDLELKVQDERLKSQKTAEIIKSMQKSGEDRTGVERDERTAESIGKLFEQQLEIIKSQSAQSSGSIEQSDERIMQVLRDMDSKTKKMRDLEVLARGLSILIVEQEHALEKLRNENDRTKEKLLSSKDKFQVKEVSWLEKIKKMKSEQEMTLKELQVANQYLHSYHDQWLGINALFKESPGIDSHPFEFGVLFNKLYSRTSDVAAKCGELEKQLNETRTAFDTTSKELLVQVKQYETLGSESKTTKTSLLGLASEKAKLEILVKEMETKLQAAYESKQQANDKLKTVTARMIEYVNDDLFLGI